MLNITIFLGIFFLYVVILLMVIYFELLEFSKSNLKDNVSLEDYIYVLKNTNKKVVIKNWLSLTGKNKAYLEFLKEYKNLLEKNMLKESFMLKINGSTLITEGKVKQKFDEEIKLNVQISSLRMIIAETNKNKREYDESVVFNLDGLKSFLNKTDNFTWTNHKILVNSGIKVHAKS